MGSHNEPGASIRPALDQQYQGAGCEFNEKYQLFVEIVDQSVHPSKKKSAFSKIAGLGVHGQKRALFRDICWQLAALSQPTFSQLKELCGGKMRIFGISV